MRSAINFPDERVGASKDSTDLYDRGVLLFVPFPTYLPTCLLREEEEEEEAIEDRMIDRRASRAEEPRTCVRSARRNLRIRVIVPI